MLDTMCLRWLALQLLGRTLDKLCKTSCTRPLWHDLGMVPMVVWTCLATSGARWISASLTPCVCAGLRCNCLAALWTRLCKTIYTRPLWHDLGMVPMVVWPFLAATWTRWIGASLTPCVCACFRCNCPAALRTRFGKTVCTRPLGHDFGMVPTVVGPFLATAWTGRIGARLTPCVCACFRPHFGQGLARQSAHIHSGMILAWYLRSSGRSWPQLEQGGYAHA